MVEDDPLDDPPDDPPDDPQDDPPGDPLDDPLDNRLLLQHHLDELIVVQLAVTVHVGLPHELLHLLVGHLLAQHGRHLLQLLGGDEAVLVPEE